MSTFSIHRGPVPVSTWDLDSGARTFVQPDRTREGVLVVEELERCGFSVEPADPESEYRIVIGDIPLADLVRDARLAGGLAMGGRQIWMDDVYFESGRGRTQIALQVRQRDGASDAWSPVLDVPVYIVPTKLGDDAYEAMTEDLQAISRGLLIDLYGKSQRTFDIRLARQARGAQSRDEELESIATVIDRLGPLLDDIHRRPSSRIARHLVRESYW